MDTSRIITQIQENPFLKGEIARSFRDSVIVQMDYLSVDDSEELLSLLDKISESEDGKRFIAFILGRNSMEEWLEEFDLFGEDDY